MPPLPNQPRKESKKPFGLSWFGIARDDDEKRRARARDDEQPPRRRDRDLIATIFGKKKHERRRRREQPSSSSGDETDYARYPLHVERALYRLSHFKLANPRRALAEQVMISNLMFWYLSVVNHTQMRPVSAASAPNGCTSASQSEYDDAAPRSAAGTGPYALHTGVLVRVRAGGRTY